MDATESNLSDHKLVDAIEILYAEIIEVGREKDHFIAYERLTNLSETGSTPDEAIRNLKRAIFSHILFIKSKMREKKKMEDLFMKASDMVYDQESE